jgi:hypothetical protein
MDMDAQFTNNMVLNSEQSHLRQDYIWPAFAPNHAALTTLDVRSGPSVSTSLTSSPKIFSNQVSNNYETRFCIQLRNCDRGSVASHIPKTYFEIVDDLSSSAPTNFPQF